MSVFLHGKEAHIKKLSFTDLNNNMDNSSNFPRTAHFSIKGYLYQFLKTIEQILQLPANGQIIIEGIEDIDIHFPNSSCLIPCKYHEEQKFHPSKVYKPIGEMIKYYLANQTSKIKYRLYAYFNENLPTGNKWITHDFLKKALSKVAPDISANISQLTEFQNRFKFHIGAKFDEMQRQVCASLQSEFSCTQSDVDYYYYNNAIAYIASLATKPDIETRTITKKSFKDNINQKSHLFDTWQRESKGVKFYIKHIRDRLNNELALKNVKMRFLFISQKLIEKSDPEFSIEKFLFDFVNQYPLKGELHNTKPWTIIIQSPKHKLQKIKLHLIKNKMYYNDGYENVFFCEKYFSDMPMVYRGKPNNDKIIEASYLIRFISAETFKEKSTAIINTNHGSYTFIYATCTNDDKFLSSYKSIIMYKLLALTNLAELITILKK